MDTAPTDHMLTAARAQRAAAEAPTTARLLDGLGEQLSALDDALDELRGRLAPVLVDETPAALTGQITPEPRTDLARRLLEHCARADRLNNEVRSLVERVEL